VACRHIRRYHGTADPAGIAPELEEAAYATLPRLLPEPDSTPPATFVVLHRGGDDGACLNADSCVWDHVPHFRGASAGRPVLGCPDRDPAHFITPDLPWTGRVGELPPITGTGARREQAFSVDDGETWVTNLVDGSHPAGFRNARRVNSGSGRGTS
jgi:hypothetical protein